MLSTILTVVAVASVAALAVVATVKEADALSTVALALAVLSLTAQLIITLVQAQQASQVSAETQAALIEVRVATSSLLTNQKEQFNLVLDAALNKAVTAAIDDVAQSSVTDGEADSKPSQAQIEQLEWALQARLKQALAAERSADRSNRAPLETWTSVARGTDATWSQERNWRKRLRTFPSEEEGKPVAEVLRTLPPSVISLLICLAPVAPPAFMSVDLGDNLGRKSAINKLMELGFIDSVERHSGRSDEKVARVSMNPKGITAYRILNGEGERPEWADGL